MKQLSIIFITLIFLSFSARSQDLLWSVKTDTLGISSANRLAVDNQNNIYLTGNGNGLINLMKYDQNGLMQYITTENEEATLVEMELESDGRIYVTGSRDHTVDNDALLQAYDTDGSLIFEQQYDLEGKDDRFVTMALDENNFIYVCGYAYNNQIEQNILVAKYTHDGTPVWIQNYNKPMYHCGASRIYVGSDGNIYIRGIKTTTSPGTIEILVLKYSPDGNLLSEFTGGVSGSNDFQTTFTIFDENNDIYVGGYTNGVIQNGFLCKISNNIMEWTHLFVASGDDASLIHGMLDDENNIICCGVYDNTNQDAYIVKISRDGGVLGEAFYNGFADQADGFMKLAIQDGFYYVCGTSIGLGTENDLLIAKYNSELSLMWDYQYNSFENDYEIANDIIIDLDGNVIVSGLSMSTVGFEAIIQKYSNPLGVPDNQSHDKFIAVYPNPATETITITGITANRYTIRNAFGGIVDEGDVSGHKINVNQLPSGIYLLSLSLGEEKYYSRFVKQ